MNVLAFIHGKGNGHITQAHSFFTNCNWSLQQYDKYVFVIDNKDKEQYIKNKFKDVNCEVIILNTKSIFHSIYHIFKICIYYENYNVYNFNCYQVNIASLIHYLDQINISHQPVVNTFYYKRFIDKWSFKLFKHKLKCFLCTMNGKNIILSYRPFYIKETIVTHPYLNKRIYKVKPNFLGYGVAYVNTFDQITCLISNYLASKISSKLVIITTLNVKKQYKSTLSSLNSISFYKPDEVDYIMLLANSNYVITGGGFQNIAEAFILHKPVFAIPDKNNIEQVLNCKDALYCQMILDIFDTDVKGLFFQISCHLYKFKSNTMLKEHRRKWLCKNK